MTPNTLQTPSPWVVRFAGRLPPGPVLDVAAGQGRHATVLHKLGHPVTVVDRDQAGFADLAPDIERIVADLEDGGPWPLGGRRFAAVVVTNYLHRPRLPDIVAAVAPGGWLLYETFADGNAAFGRPSNPDFLLRPGELLDAVRGHLTVRAYEHGAITHPRPAMVQRVAATRAL